VVTRSTWGVGGDSVVPRYYVALVSCKKAVTTSPTSFDNLECAQCRSKTETCVKMSLVSPWNLYPCILGLFQGPRNAVLHWCTSKATLPRNQVPRDSTAKEPPSGQESPAPDAGSLVISGRKAPKCHKFWEEGTQ